MRVRCRTWNASRYKICSLTCPCVYTLNSTFYGYRLQQHAITLVGRCLLSKTLTCFVALGRKVQSLKKNMQFFEE